MVHTMQTLAEVLSDINIPHLESSKNTPKCHYETESRYLYIPTHSLKIIEKCKNKMPFSVIFTKNQGFLLKMTKSEISRYLYKQGGFYSKI